MLTLLLGLAATVGIMNSDNSNAATSAVIFFPIVICVVLLTMLALYWFNTISVVLLRHIQSELSVQENLRGKGMDVTALEQDMLINWEPKLRNAQRRLWLMKYVGLPCLIPMIMLAFARELREVFADYFSSRREYTKNYKGVRKELDSLQATAKKAVSSQDDQSPFAGLPAEFWGKILRVGLDGEIVVEGESLPEDFSEDEDDEFFRTTPLPAHRS